jgi:hypothetical protein
MSRNIVVLLLGTATSVTTVATMLYLEGKIGLPLFGISGQTIFGNPLLAYLPVGAIFAGFLGSLGFLVSSMALRNRPAVIALVAILGISMSLVYLAESAELEYYIGARGTTKSAATFGRFLGVCLFHSRLYEWSLWQGGDDSQSMASLLSSGASSASHPQSAGDSKLDATQAVKTAQDVAKIGASKQLAEVTDGVESIGTMFKAHRQEWIMLSLQTVGFALGGILVYVYLRSITYCEDCNLMLSKKGEKTRYFSRSRDMHASVDEVLTRARDKQLQQAIHAHIAKGVDKDGSWSEYCSTMEIQKCLQCRTHVIDFRAMHKEAKGWKPVEALAFSTTTPEQIDFA